MPNTGGAEPPDEAPSKTTTPIRMPGVDGVNLTDSVHVCPGASVADAQFDVPVPAEKSPDGAPIVRISTMFTVPAAEAVTVTP